MLQKLRSLGYQHVESYYELCYKHVNGITSIINWDHDFRDNIVSILTDNLLSNNGLITNYINFYSFCYYPTLMDNVRDHINFTLKPELIFLNPCEYLDYSNLPPLQEPDFSKHFCFLNNRSTAERKDLFLFFEKNNLLTKSFASYNNDLMRGAFGKDNLDKPFKNFTEVLATGYDVGNNYWFYPVQKFLFDVTVETFSQFNFIGLTEKSLKSFLWGHIPLICGPTGTYRYLKELGFDIFDNIINIDFDNEQNNTFRIQRFKKEILRLSKLPLSSYDKIQLESRFIQNRNVFLKNIQKCLNTVEWIEKDIKYKISNREQYLGF